MGSSPTWFRAGSSVWYPTSPHPAGWRSDRTGSSEPWSEARIPVPQPCFSPIGAHSSRGLGRRPLTAVTPVRIRYALPLSSGVFAGVLCILRPPRSASENPLATLLQPNAALEDGGRRCSATLGSPGAGASSVRPVEGARNPAAGAVLMWQVRIPSCPALPSGTPSRARPSRWGAPTFGRRYANSGRCIRQRTASPRSPPTVTPSRLEISPSLMKRCTNIPASGRAASTKTSRAPHSTCPGAGNLAAP